MLSEIEKEKIPTLNASFKKICNAADDAGFASDGLTYKLWRILH